ncbi:MAG: von Willebrand factor type A domain-containing protein, partial [Planctomycetota bacterium]
MNPDDLNIDDEHRITAYALGELSNEERTAFEQELQSNDALKNVVEQQRDFIDSIQSSLALDVDDSAIESIKEAIAEPTVQLPEKSRGKRKWILSVVAASIGAAAVIAYPQINQRSGVRLAMKEPEESQNETFQTASSDGPYPNFQRDFEDAAVSSSVEAEYEAAMNTYEEEIGEIRDSSVSDLAQIVIQESSPQSGSQSQPNPIGNKPRNLKRSNMLAEQSEMKSELEETAGLARRRFKTTASAPFPNIDAELSGSDGLIRQQFAEKQPAISPRFSMGQSIDRNGNGAPVEEGLFDLDAEDSELLMEMDQFGIAESSGASDPIAAEPKAEAMLGFQVAKAKAEARSREELSRAKGMGGGGLYGGSAAGTPVLSKNPVAGREQAYSEMARGAQRQSGRVDSSGPSAADLSAIMAAAASQSAMDQAMGDLEGRMFYSAEEAKRAYYQNANRYKPQPESPFKSVSDEPLSTFSVDVDTASFTKILGEFTETFNGKRQLVARLHRTA